jgi:hypothetical protein
MLGKGQKEPIPLSLTFTHRARQMAGLREKLLFGRTSREVLTTLEFCGEAFRAVPRSSEGGRDVLRNRRHDLLPCLVRHLG